MHACVYGNDWSLSFCHAYLPAGLQLNVVHYTTLMSCLQRAGQVRAPLHSERLPEQSGWPAFKHSAMPCA